MSPNEKGTIYIGAQFLFRSRDHGQSWDRISPDLTTNDPEKQKQEESGGVTVDNSAAEMHTTIYSISESPKNGQIIWVGTDDGNVQVTRDGAQDMDERRRKHARPRPRTPGCHVEAEPLQRGTAYATFDRHTYGDMKPYVVQDDRLRQDLDVAAPREQSGVRGYAHVIKEDIVDPILLFVGTEFGLWISRRRRRAVGAVQGQRLSGGRGARHRHASARRRIWCWPRTAAASGSSTTSRRCARSRRTCMAKDAAVLDGRRRCSTSTPMVGGQRRRNVHRHRAARTTR